MDIKTITYHSVHNYGAVLQSYALQKTLISLGFDNEIIDFSKDKMRIFNRNELKFNRSNISSLISNLLKLFCYFKLKRNYSRFEDFINNELILTDKYKSFEDISKSPPKADCFIAGSDQIWNATNGCFPAFFLDFGDMNTKRISYAASMGVYNLSAENEKQFIDYINSFDEISVREEDAKKYIEGRTNKKCFVNIDPVFLIDNKKWSQLSCDNLVKRKYILCYPLIYNNLLNDSLQKLKMLTGYPIVVISQQARNNINGDIYIRDAGPKEFLSLIKNAEYVVTTSFHGTAFSIIFEKKFFSFVGSHAPTRITNILNKFDLSNRMVTDLSQISLSELNFNATKEIIIKEKQKAIEYLKNSTVIFNE